MAGWTGVDAMLNCLSVPHGGQGGVLLKKPWCDIKELEVELTTNMQYTDTTPTGYATPNVCLGKLAAILDFAF